MPPVPALDNAHPSSVREVLDSSGAVVARYDYSPFGEVAAFTGSVICYFANRGN